MLWFKKQVGLYSFISEPNLNLTHSQVKPTPDNFIPDSCDQKSLPKPISQFACSPGEKSSQKKEKSYIVMIKIRYCPYCLSLFKYKFYIPCIFQFNISTVA